MAKDNLSGREHELLLMGLRSCLLTPDALKIDLAKFAELAGFQNPRSASSTWSNIKSKLGLIPATSNASPAKATKAKHDDEKVTPKKRKLSADPEPDEAVSPLANRVKKVPASAKKATKKTEENETAADAPKGNPAAN